MTIFRVTDMQTMYGQQIQNVLHFSKSTGSFADMQALATDFSANWISRVRLLQTASIQHINIKVEIVNGILAPYNATINIAGSNTGSTEHKTYLAHKIKLLTLMAGKHGRGRVYIAGMANNLTQNGFLTSSILTSWNTQLLAIINSYGPPGTSPFRLIIWSPSGPPEGVPVETLQMGLTEGIQRRRNIGVGI